MGKEHVNDAYSHPAYLNNVQGALSEIPGWMKQKLESRLPGEISVASHIPMALPIWQKEKRN